MRCRRDCSFIGPRMHGEVPVPPEFPARTTPPEIPTTTQQKVPLPIAPAGPTSAPFLPALPPKAPQKRGPTTPSQPPTQIVNPVRNVPPTSKQPIKVPTSAPSPKGPGSVISPSKTQVNPIIVGSLVRVKENPPLPREEAVEDLPAATHLFSGTEPPTQMQRPPTALKEAHSPNPLYRKSPSHIQATFARQFLAAELPKPQATPVVSLVARVEPKALQTSPHPLSTTLYSPVGPKVPANSGAPVVARVVAHVGAPVVAQPQTPRRLTPIPPLNSPSKNLEATLDHYDIPFDPVYFPGATAEGLA